MSETKSVAVWRRWLASFLAGWMALGPLMMPAYATNLADQPLGVQNQATPNIMLTIDDSSSMLYDFLPDGAISTYCRDITGRMRADCGRLDNNIDNSGVGRGKYVTPGFIYEQFGFPFPAYDASFDASGPGAGCQTVPVATAHCVGAVAPGPLPGLERYPGPPGIGKSPFADQPYEYWTLWPAPVHNSELNHAYYNPRLTYDPPKDGSGGTYPQMTAGNTTTWTRVPADPWASTVKYVDLTQSVTIGLWCNSDWSQGLETNPAYCRTNGVGPTAATSSTPSADGDYYYPWAPPGIDPSTGSSTSLSIAYTKVNSTTHALLPLWIPAVTPAKDPKFFYQNDNTLWCDTTSPLWPNYGVFQAQTCSNPAPARTPQVCQGLTDQTCSGGSHETCVGVQGQTCQNAQPQQCNNINAQICVGAQPQICTGGTGQTCDNIGNQTCGAIAPQTCNGAQNPTCDNIIAQTCGGAVNQTCGNYVAQSCDGAVFPTCDNITGQSCDGAVNQTCTNVTSQTCDNTVPQSCDNIIGQTCDNVQPQSCDAVGEVCNLPDPDTCPLVWKPDGCPCGGPECSACHLERDCPPGVCSVTGGSCQASGECPGTRQCSISHGACNVATDCLPVPGNCSIETTKSCTVQAQCGPLGQCSLAHNACASVSDCAIGPGNCSVRGNSCTTAAECVDSGTCSVFGSICTVNGDCPNTAGHCSVSGTGCAVVGDCPAAGHCSNNGNLCTGAAECPSVAGTCNLDGMPCLNQPQCANIGHCTASGNQCTNNFGCPNTPGLCSVVPTNCAIDTDCPDEGHCSNNGNACTGPGQCPAVSGTCSTDGAACANDTQCPDEGHCTLVGNVCTTDLNCPTQPGHCTLSGTACANNTQCLPFGAHCSVSGLGCTLDIECPTVQGRCNLDAAACTVDTDCSGAGQCSIVAQVCHGDIECATVPGTCSNTGTACTTDASCAAIPGHCSATIGIACVADAGCPGTDSTCSVTGESCSGTYDPICDNSTATTCTQPAYCPRQGGTCSIDGSPCLHTFFPPTSDYATCPDIVRQGQCSLNGAACSSDSDCPATQTGGTVVCSDLVAGSTTLSIPVPNGTFDVPATGDYAYNPGGASWNFVGGSGVQRRGGSFGINPSSDPPQTAFIQGLGRFSQSIVIPVGSYRISFDLARRPYSVPAGTSQPIVVKVDGVIIGGPLSPTDDSGFRSATFGFSIATAGPHVIEFAGTDGTGDKSTLIDKVQITSGMSLLEDANGAGLVCRHNNQAYGAIPAARYNYPNAQFNMPVTAGTGPNACVASPRYTSVPRHYYKTSVEWCNKQVFTVGDPWLDYGTPTGGSCQDSSDTTHVWPRFYKFGQPGGTDNYAIPAFQRIDLDITKRGTARFVHDWLDENGLPVPTVDRSFDEEMTNYANWFAYYRTRITAVKTATSIAFDVLDAKYRVGLHSLSTVPTNPPHPHTDPVTHFVDIANFAAAQKTAWYNELFSFRIPLGVETPSLDALWRIGDYFLNGTQPQLRGANDPINLTCQKNYHMFFTDGVTHQADLPTYRPGNEDNLVPFYPQWDTKPIPGLVPNDPWPHPFREDDPTGVASNALSDYAMHYWVTDLRTVGPFAANTVATSDKDPASWQHLNFAALSLGTTGVLDAGNQPGTEARLKAGTLQWPKPNPVFNPGKVGVDDLWHAALNGRGRFVNAESVDELQLGIGKVLADVTNQAGVRIGVGFRSVNLGPAANFVYRVGFEPGWGGSLTKVQIDPTTGAELAQQWSAADQLDIQLTVTALIPDPWNTQRKIVTVNEAGVPIRFLWANLGPAQRDSLAPGKPAARTQAIVDFLRGNRLKEGAKLNQFRERTSALGDIVDSSAVYVGKANAPYRDATDPFYSDFREAQKNRAARIYVGANDGMLHGFDDETGKETWAFVPGALYRGGLAGGDEKLGLGALSYQDGALPPFKHHFYVDASPKVVDVNFAADTGGDDWHSLLVSGLGKGGAEYFALDVTDPSPVNEAAAMSKVLWEFKNAELGYTYGKPIIAKTHGFNGAWVVILTTGYNNPGGVGKLFFVEASSGRLLHTMSTGVGSNANPSGLAHPAAYTKDFHNQLAEQVYAGDLLGNFWRFDLSSDRVGDWTVERLGRLVDDGGAPQPVTTPPQIEIDIGNGVDRWVFVGTGKLYHDDDLADTQTQTLYAFRDGTSENPWPIPSPVLSRTNPGVVPLIHDLAHNFGVNNKPDKGWFDDLPAGQRIVVPPQAALSIIAYIGTSPETDPCLGGTRANVYARDYSTGQSQLINGGGTVIESVPIPEGGVGLEIVSVQAPAGGPPDIRIVITPAIKGKPLVIIKPKPPALLIQHRMSWRLIGE